MNITCIPTKQLFYNPANEYRVVSCSPVHSEEDMQLNQYGSFTVSGSNLSSLAIGKEIELDIRQDQRSKYPASYVLIGYGGIETNKEKISIQPSKEFQLLCQIMEDRQAKYINEAYPDFISRIMNGQEETIDYHNIYNVGAIRLEDYINKIKANFTMILFTPVADKWKCNEPEVIKKLMAKYNTPDEASKAFDENPYKCLIELAGFSFARADRIVTENRPDLIDSSERCEYGILSILEENELEGDTRLNANILARATRTLIPECKDKIVEVVTSSPLIHYDCNNKYTAKESTYQAECNITRNIKERQILEKTLIPDNVNYEKYRSLGGVACTDEQLSLLKVANEHKVCMLMGSAGCVDADTEFFCGTGWKRIADYEKGDKVFQYNQDGTAELVAPEEFVKVPCNTLWHFETKYGINQTICDEHRVIYWSAKGVQHECNVQDIIVKQKGNGWKGKFKTTFSYNGTGIDLTDEQIRVMCAVICDGSFYTQAKEHQSSYQTCRFHLKKERKKIRLLSLCKQAGIDVKYAKSANVGYDDYYIMAPIRTKEFTPIWYNCSQHQLQVICDEIIYWDGSENITKNGTARKSFSTTIKTTADFVQFAFSACGYRASIHIYDRRGQKYLTNNKLYVRKSCTYEVRITKRNFVGLCCDNRTMYNKTEIKQVPTTDGYKYCFRVPSGMLVLRRKNNIFITGNCGKSTCTKALIEMLDDLGKTYLLLAPTGVASKRLSEATNRQAYTIHLYLSRIDLHIPYDYVLIDECSMVSVELLSDLFKQVNADCNLVFVCDNAQLVSISCGNVVQDFVDSGTIPIVNLSKVFRYGIGGIATISTDTRNGKYGRTEQYSDYKLISSNHSITQIVEAVEELVYNNGYKLDDIMVLCPFNKGKIGSLAINEAIQKRFNTHDDTKAIIEVNKHPIMFKVGDKVINTKNNYSAELVEWSTETDENGEEINGWVHCGKTAIFNGDIGKVREVSERDNHLIVLVEFDNGIVEFVGSEISKLLLGYCISIHKSQGSQAKAVVVVIDKMHEGMITRNLAYVADSRAQEFLVEIIDKYALESGLNRVENKERDTWLKELLTNEETNSQ